MPSTLVLTSVSLDTDVDEALKAEAVHTGKSKASLFRHHLRTGMKATTAQRVAASYASRFAIQAPLILRTIHVDGNLEERLRAESFDTRTPKEALIRGYLRVGMLRNQAIHEAPPQQPRPTHRTAGTTRDGGPVRRTAA